ncbi:hypothetical protein [Chromobacterium amazonense]|uniref:hypothetical protein n=1 Tax=Chromobacterium amazonense TaxID=1382803 RepID=UPI003F7AA022
MKVDYQILPVTGEAPKPGEPVIIRVPGQGFKLISRKTLPPPSVELQIFKLHDEFKK